MGWLIKSIIGALGEKVVIQIAIELTKWKKRRDIRLLVEDLVLDEMRDLMYSFSTPNETIMKVLRKRRKKVAREVKIRLLAVLK